MTTAVPFGGWLARTVAIDLTAEVVVVSRGYFDIKIRIEKAIK